MEKLILDLYTLVLLIALVFVSPILLFVPKTRAGLKQKFGLIDKSIAVLLKNKKQAIWIHSVSVGEFNGVFPLVLSLKEKYPDKSLVISTTTEAGQLLAKQRAGHLAQIIYFPFDLPWSINRFLSLIEPSLVIIFETELWPNFIQSCWLRKIPVAILNARMSPRSFKRYKLLKWFFGPILRKLVLIATQTNIEAEHYKAIGGDDLPIKTFGNLKYDWPALIDDTARLGLRNKLGLNSEDIVLIAGSTHAGEEELILDTYKNALAKLQNGNAKTLRLIIAPRHPERFDTVAKTVGTQGYKVRRYSNKEEISEASDIVLLDTIGELANFYSIADLAFVGGSIAKIGGHNLLEPYLYSVPVVCGPHLFKTKESANILKNENALFIGDNEAQVQSKIIQLLQDESLRKKMGHSGKLWLENNRGAVKKTVENIAIFLDKPNNIVNTCSTDKIGIVT